MLFLVVSFERLFFVDVVTVIDLKENSVVPLNRFDSAIGTFQTPFRGSKARRRIDGFLCEMTRQSHFNWESDTINKRTSRAGYYPI